MVQLKIDDYEERGRAPFILKLVEILALCKFDPNSDDGNWLRCQNQNAKEEKKNMIAKVPLHS